MIILLRISAGWGVLWKLEQEVAADSGEGQQACRGAPPKQCDHVDNVAAFHLPLLLKGEGTMYSGWNVAMAQFENHQLTTNQSLLTMPELGKLVNKELHPAHGSKPQFEVSFLTIVWSCLISANHSSPIWTSWQGSGGQANSQTTNMVL